MRKQGKGLLTLFLSAVLVLSPFVANKALASGGTPPTVEPLSYTAYVEGYDWGPGLSKVVVDLQNAEDLSTYTTSNVAVTVTKKSFAGSTTATRTVTDVYPADTSGNKITGTTSQYMAVEMSVSPSDDLSNPFFYDFSAGFNVWANPYSYQITFGSHTASVLTKNVIPDDALFTKNGGTYEKINLSYGSYAPATDTKKNPLIIWLHGAGEGGTDPSIAILGNKVTSLVSDETQSIFGGAYVLVPQCPTMWMDNTGSKSYGTDGTSYYTKALMALIKSYVNSNADIDTSRIYIGGCSNGGFMTVNMLKNYPDYFAAAFPVCEAYPNEALTDADIRNMKDIPIWFTHSANDTMVAISKYTLKTYGSYTMPELVYDADGKLIPEEVYTRAAYHRLLAAGAENVHFSIFDDVHDTSGKYKKAGTSDPYQYTGHWSWIYTLNNECTKDYDGSNVMVNGKNVSIMEWLAAQKKTELSYTAYTEGFDWGPGVVKVVVDLGKTEELSNYTKSNVTVSVTKQSYAGISTGTRTVTNVYASDANGNKMSTTSSNYMAVEMSVSPSDDFSNPFFYNFTAGFNVWANPYNYQISFGSHRASILTKNVIPRDAMFTESSSTYENITLSYGSYAPTKDSKQNPLFIWLHGAGEGGTDPSIALLGNKVSNLVSPEIQNIFSGAYVLTPQSPTMWMDNTGKKSYGSDGTSFYTKALMNLIETYVNNNADIDKNRIYIGGCSNGGFMTINMLKNYPDYFAAAFPICEAYPDNYLTDSDIQNLKNIPIWFTHAANDTTVAISKYKLVNNGFYDMPVLEYDANGKLIPQSLFSRATYARLKAAGAENVHFSLFNDVHDTSGKYTASGSSNPYQYNGHWSWIYTLNNECTKDYDGSNVVVNGKNVTIMEWLAAQAKVAKGSVGVYIPGGTSEQTGSKVDLPEVNKELDILDASYKVTKSDKEIGSVSYLGTKDKTDSKIVVPETIEIDGVAFKVTEISKDAFNGNKKIKEVYVGKNVKEIGKNAFRNCTSLKTVTLTSNVESIGENAFAGAKKLTVIKIKTTKLTTIGENAFKTIDPKAVIKVPAKKYEEYKKMILSSNVKSTVRIVKY